MRSRQSMRASWAIIGGVHCHALPDVVTPAHPGNHRKVVDHVAQVLDFPKELPTIALGPLTGLPSVLRARLGSWQGVCGERT